MYVYTQYIYNKSEKRPARQLENAFGTPANCRHAPSGSAGDVSLSLPTEPGHQYAWPPGAIRSRCCQKSENRVLGGFSGKAKGNQPPKGPNFWRRFRELVGECVMLKSSSGSSICDALPQHQIDPLRSFQMSLDQNTRALLGPLQQDAAPALSISSSGDCSGWAGGDFELVLLNNLSRTYNDAQYHQSVEAVGNE